MVYIVKVSFQNGFSLPRPIFMVTPEHKGFQNLLIVQIQILNFCEYRLKSSIFQVTLPPPQSGAQA